MSSLLNGSGVSELIRYSNSQKLFKHKQLHDVIKDKHYILLCFGFRECTYCHKLFEKLIPLYDQVKNVAEFIYVNADTCIENYEQTIKRYPWYSIPYNGGGSSFFIKKHRVNLYPSLILYNLKTGKINENLQTTFNQNEKEFLSYFRI